MQGEIAEQIRSNPIQFEPLVHGRKYHLYEYHNLGAADLASELQDLAKQIAGPLICKSCQCDACSFICTRTWTTDQELCLRRRQGLRLGADAPCTRC